MVFAAIPKFIHRIRSRSLVAGLTCAFLAPGCGLLGGGPGAGAVEARPTARALSREEPGVATTLRAGATLSAMIALGHAQEAYAAGRMTTGRLRAEAARLSALVSALEAGDASRHGTLCAQASLLLAEVELQALEGPGIEGAVEARAYRELIRERGEVVVEEAELGEEASESPEVLLAMVEESSHLDADLDGPSQERVLQRLDVKAPLARLDAAIEEAEASEGWALIWPLDEVRVTSPFGMRRDPIRRSAQKMHRGTDLAGARGTPVRSAGPGTIVLAGWGGRGTGNAVVIRHPKGVVTQYFHLSKVRARAGAVVRAGEVIGEVGATGRATGPHLHFQVSIEGEAVDPEAWIGERFE